MTELAQLVPARDVQAGDRIVLPQIGSRVVVDGRESTFGLEETPCIRIVYALGMSQAFENRARSRGPVSCVQPEAGLRPLRHDELVLLASRRS